MFLYIPMTVRALPVGKPSPKTHFSGFSYDMRRLGDRTEHTEAPPFEESAREPGVYLHWSLPACFTSGSQDGESGEITYRLAPNRFSVTRLWTDADNRLQSRTFLLESDSLYKDRTPENQDSPSIPCPWPDEEHPWRFQGRSFDAADPPADYPHTGDSYLRLTALSENCPFFAAYAPACQNVFGFVDRVEELSHVTLSYVVCGWYEEHGEPEPCSLIKSLRELEDTMGLTVQGDPLPDRAFCHGMVENIPWETKDTVYPTGTPDDPEPGEIVVLPKVGIGNTSAEVLAALLQPPDGNLEHLLHHYLAGTGKELDQSSGAVKADNRMKQLGFCHSAALTMDGLRDSKPDQESEGEEVYDRQSLERLRELRAKQRKCQLLYGEYVQKQRQAYEKWYLHYYSDTEYYRSMYLKEMQDALTEVQNLSQALYSTGAEIQKQEKQLALQLPLQQEAVDSFYSPADPVVLIAQLAPQDFPGALEGALLPCRTEGQLISALRLSDIPLFHSLPEGMELLPSDMALSITLPPHLDARLQQGIRACVEEGVFLANSCSFYLAGLACRKAGITPGEEELSLLAARIADLQSKRDQHFQGIQPDSCGLNSYHASWSPLIVEWEICYYPDMELLCPGPSLKNWTMTQGDHTFCGDQKKICNPDNGYYIQGRFFISDTASKRLKDTVQKLPGSDLLYEGAREMQYLSQALSGFNSQLLMRDASVAMDFFSRDPQEKKLLEQIRQLLPSELAERPVFDELFSPVRAGFLRLHKLRLIDRMGYYQDIDRPSVYAGEGMLPPGENNPVSCVMLPPRLPQPLMLSAFLADASRKEPTESLAVPEASPVCGYLAANYLNQSIMVYTASGVHSCSICLTQTGASIRMENAPLLPRTPVPPSDLDPQMAAFLQGLLAKGPDALRDLLRLIDQMQIQVRLGDHAHHIMDYFGCPIAVVRASLQFTFYGTPEGYRHNPDGGEMDRTHGTDISGLSLPVQVGQPDNPLDGVYGFFEDEDYQCFHSYPEEHFDSGYIVFSDRISLSLKPRTPPKSITLLMDPYSEANLVTGVLPVKTLCIPQKLVAQGLEELSVSYSSAPVLCGDTLREIPVPHTNSMEFFWTAESQNGSTRLLPVDNTAVFPDGRLSLREGYIVIKEKEKEETRK